MGLRSPQDMKQVPLQAEPNARFNGGQVQPLSKEFLGVGARAVNAQESAYNKAKAEELDFVKTTADNDAENDKIQASAELAQFEGLSTLDKSQKLREKLQEKYSKRMKDIPEQYHKYVAPIFEKKVTGYNKFAVPYMLGQVRKVKDEADKVFAANAIDEAINESSDIESFNGEHLAKVVYAVGKRAEKKFNGNPELMKEAITLGVSETIRRSVEQQAVLGRFDKADELLKKFDDELTPKDRVKAIKLMAQARDDMGDKEASDLATQAGIQYPDDLEKQELWLRGSSRNDKVHRAATAFLRSRVAVQKLQKEKHTEKVYAQVTDAIARGNPAAAMEAVSSLPPGEEREKVFKWYNDTRGGQNVLTNFDAFDKLNERITNSHTAQSLEDLDLNSHRMEIGPDNMKVLESKLDRLKSSDNKEMQRVHRLNYDIVEKQFTAFAQANGLSGKGKTKERGTLRVALMEEVERILTVDPKISARDLRSRVTNTLRERGMTEKTVDRWYWFDKKTKEPNKSLAPDNSPRVHPSVYQLIRKSRPDYSEAQINAAIQQLIKNGKDVTSPRN